MKPYLTNVGILTEELWAIWLYWAKLTGISLFPANTQRMHMGTWLSCRGRLPLHWSHWPWVVSRLTSSHVLPQSVGCCQVSQNHLHLPTHADEWRQCLVTDGPMFLEEPLQFLLITGPGNIWCFPQGAGLPQCSFDRHPLGDWLNHWTHWPHGPGSQPTSFCSCPG